ncbi:MAG: NAD-dependent epimerase/dehydratase family protein [Candidatus Thorarchaeota archaeon]
MKVLLTGTTGFLGRKLAKRLIEAEHDVIALVRSSSNTAGLDEKIELREGDLLNVETLETAVKDAEVVIHLAAYFDFYPSDKELLYRVNVEGTNNLMNACVGSAVSRFIYCSTTETIGPVRFPPGNEDTELSPAFDYAKSKILAEQSIRKISEDTNIPHIILRPTGILGEGDMYTAYELIKAINDSAIPMLAGDGEKRIMYTHVDDIVDGFMAALESKSAINQTIILCPDHPMTYSDLITFIGNALGVKPPTRRVPTRLAKLGMSLMSPIKNRGRTTFLWHAQTVQSMDEERFYTNDKAKKLLGWKPKHTMQEGLQKSIEWYYAEGHLEKRS